MGCERKKWYRFRFVNTKLWMHEKCIRIFLDSQTKHPHIPPKNDLVRRHRDDAMRESPRSFRVLRIRESDDRCILGSETREDRHGNLTHLRHREIEAQTFSIERLRLERSHGHA